MMDYRLPKESWECYSELIDIDRLPLKRKTARATSVQLKIDKDGNFKAIVETDEEKKKLMRHRPQIDIEREQIKKQKEKNKLASRGNYLKLPNRRGSYVSGAATEDVSSRIVESISVTLLYWQSHLLDMLKAYYNYEWSTDDNEFFSDKGLLARER